MIWDAMLREAALLSEAAYVRHFESSSATAGVHVFSTEFEKSIVRLKRRTERPLFYRFLRAVASVLLALLFAGSAWLAVDAEARTAFIGWIKDFYGTYFVYRYDDSPLESAASVNYQLTWLPTGYTEFFSDEMNGEMLIVYANEAGQLLKFKYIDSPDAMSWWIDASNVTRKQAAVEGNLADLLLSESLDTASAILWTDADDTAFYISGFLNEDDLIKIAESVRKSKKE